MALPAVTLHTKFPCCGGPARIVALVDVPRQTYKRECGKCGKRWDVERADRSSTPAYRIDVLNWSVEG